MNAVSNDRWKRPSALEGALSGAVAGLAFAVVDRVLLAVTTSAYDDYAIFARLTGWADPASPGAMLWGAVLHLVFAAGLGALFVFISPRKAAPFLGPLYGLALTLGMVGVAERFLGHAAPLMSYDLVTVGRIFGVRILWGFVLGTLLFLGVLRHAGKAKAR